MKATQPIASSATSWSNSEEDVRPAGGARAFSITTHPSGTQFPVLQQIKKTVIDPGNGNLRQTG